MTLRISAWSIRNPIPVIMMTLLFTIAGLFAYASMPVSQFPNLAMPVMSVTIIQEGAAPSEIESQITRVVEDSVASINKIDTLNSTVTLGKSSTIIQFEIGTDMQKAVEDVRTSVDRIRSELPDGIEPPIVQRLDWDVAPVATYVVSAPKMSMTQLSWFMDNTIARELQELDGIALAQRIGGAKREINVILDPDRMEAFNVTAAEVSKALYAFNIDDPGGRANVAGGDQSIRIIGSALDVERMRDLEIAAGGRHVRLSDIAEVGDGQSELRSFARFDGRPVVAIQVSKTKEASEVDVDTEVRAAVKEMARKYPDVSFTEVMSTGELARKTFSATQHVLIEGIVLAVVVVFFFLRDARATAIAAIAMPLSLIPTFIFMWLMDFSLNLVSLLALTLVIGILVDDAIVEIENIQKRIEGGESPYRASLIGADAIGLAVIATTASIVTVFAPVSLMPGTAGQFFREFGLTIAVAVTFSLIVARLLTPLLTAYFLKPHRRVEPEDAHRMHPTYARILEGAITRPWLHAGLGVLLFILAIVFASQLSVGLQPVSDSGRIYMAVTGAPGARRDTMDRAVQRATKLLLAEPDVAHVFAQIGSVSSSTFVSAETDLREGSLTVVLKPERTHTTAEFQAMMGEKLQAVPEARFAYLTDFDQAAISVVLAGEDGAALERAQSELLRQMRTLSLVANPRPTPPLPGPELVITPRPDEAARLNVDSRSLAETVRIATMGDIDASIAKFSAGAERLPIRVRMPESARDEIDRIAALRVPTMEGENTSLGAVADIDLQAGPAKIVRFDRERRVAVEADLAVGAAIGDALAQIEALPIMKKLPPGVHPADDGASKQIKSLFGGFLLVLLSGIALTFTVLVLLFKDMLKPLAIMVALPLSILGAMFMLWITGFALDMPSLIGLLMLMGLCAKNSILLVEFAIEDEAAGTPMLQALRNACAQRTRPIIMTTFAMAAGMLPTALAIGDGSELRQPMAIAVIGGMATSTVLSLIFVPAFYVIIDRLEKRIAPFFRRMVTRDDEPGEAEAV